MYRLRKIDLKSGGNINLGYSKVLFISRSLIGVDFEKLKFYLVLGGIWIFEYVLELCIYLI